VQREEASRGDGGRVETPLSVKFDDTPPARRAPTK
jgi:hypothetical protein